MNAVFSITAVALGECIDCVVLVEGIRELNAPYDPQRRLVHGMYRHCTSLQSRSLISPRSPSQIPTIGKLYLFFFPSPDVQFTPGPFFLGKWGYAINAYAICWTMLETGVLIIAPALSRQLGHDELRRAYHGRRDSV